MDAKIERLLDIRDSLRKVILYGESLERLKPRIIWLSDTIIEMKKDEAKYSKRIANLRKKCSHNWEYGGHGHNDDWYVCTICGETEDR